MNKLEKFLLNFVPISRWRKLIRQYDYKILYNVFNKNYSKKVLVSYIQAPFTQKSTKTHTNILECKTACEIFDELGYQVDVVDYLQTIPTKEIQQYDVVYGFGRCFNIACSNPNLTTIYYGTGCSIVYCNKHTFQKVIDFYNKTQKWCFDSCRYVNGDNGVVTNFAKGLILLGNDFVKDTYKNDTNSDRLYNLNAFYYDTHNPNLEEKDFSKVKNNFLYFGSIGALHKGLDVLIDIFKKRQDINLTICGFNPKESEFYEYYQDVFDGKYSNIKYYKFVDMESDLYKEIVDNSSAIITPSVSEGGAAATVACMANGGLIPIASKTTGLDISQYGFEFEHISAESVEEKINQLLNMTDFELKDLSLKVLKETGENYSYENYRKNIKNLITKIIDGDKNE